MENLKDKLFLYAVTDRNCLKTGSLATAVEQAIQGGATFVQLREKHTSKEEISKLALEIKSITAKYSVPFVLDDEVELAKKLDVDGVHIGQNDMTVEQAREILGSDKIIGVTARSLEQAIKAEKGGADYLGIGAIFATGTKQDTTPMSLETVKAITNTVKIPVVGIAGINKNNVIKLKNCGLDGIAVVSAIFGEENPKAAASELKDILTENNIIDNKNIELL
jgi:thiamine-phosphate pyrophosphorylase